MTVELKIVAEDATNLLVKLAEIAKSMTTGGEVPVTIDDMIGAINMQLPEGMECVIVDHNKDETGTVEPKAEEAKKAPTKRKPRAKKTPATKPADEAPSDFDAALDILAACYVDDKGKAVVNALLKKYDVRRFADIDSCHAPDLLKAATKIKVDCGL